MKILITCAGFPPAFLGGGPIRTISAMIDQANPKHKVWVLTNNFDHGDSMELVASNHEWKRAGNASILYVSPGLLNLINGIRRALQAGPDVIYLNGLFYPRLSISMQLVTALIGNAAVVIAPRGELDPGALEIKSKKKSVFLKAFRATGANRRVIWHASTKLESKNIRRIMGDSARVIVRENDNMLPATAMRPVRNDSKVLKLVFMSRISPKKGLHIVLAALAEVDHEIVLEVIGPEEDENYVTECRKLAEDMPNNVSVHFVGAIKPRETRDRLAGYDLMVLPTAGENFGHVIAESLSVGCPVMCSATTPWTERLSDGAGVVVERNNSSEWAVAIGQYAELGPASRFNRRVKAAEGYNEWKGFESEPHFFELLEKELGRA